MSAVQPGGHAERAAGMVAGSGGHDWVQQAQVHATLAVADAIRDLIAEVANLAELADCTPARPARRPWWRRSRRSAGGAR
ncbi:MAG TPA: hypothetical protein VK586_16875 [Streptosporangiaceae bacterium]|nr:hypothetical protein [Streptosporangiaceae bacterium]